MTRDPEEARKEAEELAEQTLVAYTYKLRSGYFYVSADPPSMVSSEYVSTTYFKNIQKANS